MTAAIIFFGIFFVGIVAGVVAVVCVGIWREERNFSLTRQAPGLVSEGARLLTGLHVRQRSDVDSREDMPV